MTEGFSRVEAINKVGETVDGTVEILANRPEGVTKAEVAGTKAATAAAAAILFRLDWLDAIFMVLSGIFLSSELLFRLVFTVLCKARANRSTSNLCMRCGRMESNAIKFRIGGKLQRKMMRCWVLFV